MSNNITNYIRENRIQEIEKSIESILNDLAQEGLSVEFGNIGIRTTYALIHDKSHDVEIVGYTFLKNMKFYQEEVGRLKALQQAVARKELSAESQK